MTNGLFKYFPTDEDKLERFTNGQIYLTPPKYFNDPWDFRLRSEPPTEKQVKKEVPLLRPGDVPDSKRTLAVPALLRKKLASSRMDRASRSGSFP